MGNIDLKKVFVKNPKNPVKNSSKRKMSSGYKPISSPPVEVGWSASLEKTLDTLSKSWPEVALKVGMTSATHPLDLAKTLIQIGHEPIAPKHTKTWLGRPALSLPSVFIYMGHIRRRDGFLGLYRGLGPKLVSMGVSSVVSDQFAQLWPKSQYEDTEDDELDEEQKRQKAIDAAIKEIMERFAIIAVTQPLHVVVVRAMASFVGQESDYNNIFSGLVSIYRESGKQFSVRLKQNRPKNCPKIVPKNAKKSPKKSPKKK